MFQSSAKSSAVSYVVTANSSPVLDKSIQIFPSPTHHNLNIKYNGSPSSFAVPLVDLYGRNLMQKQFSTSIELNLNRLVAGTYVVHIINIRTKEHIQRLIIKL